MEGRRMMCEGKSRDLLNDSPSSTTATTTPLPVMLRDHTPLTLMSCPISRVLTYNVVIIKGVTSFVNRHGTKWCITYEMPLRYKLGIVEHSLSTGQRSLSLCPPH